MKKSWAIYGLVILGVCLIVGVINFPFFATRPLSKSELLGHLAEGLSDIQKDQPPQGFTGYPPSVYMQFFTACSSDEPCTRTHKFRVDPVPKGCCILTVTNGNGQGKDEVRSYEVMLNGKSVIPTDRSRNAQATVAVQISNTIKVILTGEPTSKVFISIDYDPRQSK